MGKLDQFGNWVGGVWDDLTGVTASEQATEQLGQANVQATDLYRDFLGTAGEAYGPYLESGKENLGRLNDLLSGEFDVSSLPGFDVGLEAVNKRNIARGRTGGAYDTGIIDYATGKGGDYLNQLLRVNALDQNALNTFIGTAGNLTGQIGAGITGGGQIGAAGTLGGYNTKRDFIMDILGLGVKAHGAT